jgi:hypothetical protein
MPLSITEIQGWYMSFLLLGLWVCVGLILLYLRASRRRRREEQQRRERDAWRHAGHETVEDLERELRDRQKE